ncbi:uncharacterized protein LOC125559911 [Nematostella vectensis]|uniref:uncharacterized protein LOC125559911 n=1 Tax=Nematostella vectensis TaxID=45351 RepID=UPI0020776060|nr:uncharacterized protein LOC125559911 [Nematostella vectensis]
MAYPRHHITSKNCDGLKAIHHIGGRYFLSVTSGTLTTNNGPMRVTPLAVFHLPCNVSFESATSGIGECPQRMEIELPIFGETHLQYTSWKSVMDDKQLDLHFRTLIIPPVTVMNHSILRGLDETYRVLDRQFTAQIDKIHGDIEAISEVEVNTINEILLYASVVVSLLNFFLLMAYACYHHGVFERLKHQRRTPLPPPPPTLITSTRTPL